MSLCEFLKGVEMRNAIPVIFGCLSVIVWAYIIVAVPTDVASFMFCFTLGSFCSFVALILAVSSAFKLIQRKANVGLHTTGIIVCAVSILMMVYSVRYIAIPQVEMSRRGANIAEIAIAFHLYLDNHSNQFPDSSSWCDLLVKDGYITSAQLLDASGAKSQRGYALNANALKYSKMPDDVVLLFESKPEWNSVGGKELLIKDNKKGCWILFGDTSTRYIDSKEFDDLRWQ